MPQQCCWYAKKGGAPGWTLRLFVRTCFHKKYMWIFEHNFVADKKKIRRRAVARQVFFTQYAAKFAEKTRVYACEDRFLFSRQQPHFHHAVQIRDHTCDLDGICHALSHLERKGHQRHTVYRDILIHRKDVGVHTI